jgi:hypothetical protein
MLPSDHDIVVKRKVPAACGCHIRRKILHCSNADLPRRNVESRWPYEHEDHMKISSERVFLAGAIAMTIGLTLVAMTPLSTSMLAPMPHRSAHVVAYALVAYAWGRGMPLVPAPVLVLACVALGFAHEALEIVGHRHPFELADAYYNAAGAIAGVVLSRVPMRKRKA